MASEEPRPFGAYVLLKALGRGAMGDVHLARPYNPNRGVPTPVVIKRLHGELAKKKGFVSRFKHEASIAVSVDSPHVAKVYDVGAVGDTLYIVMEYVAGWPLSKVLDMILKSGRHASIASVVDSIAGGLEGLLALHTAHDSETGKPLGIVHRDISPKNLMIGEDGLMHIIDLGLGKSNAQDWKTRTGVVMGSVGYMPPEQVNGEHVDARADVYAMGVVSYEMLALRNYIKRGPLASMMSASMQPKFNRPSEFRPDVPRGLDEVIERAVKPNKDERYPSAEEFLKGLRAIVPASHTKGGMRELIKELFDDTRKEREREMEMLLSLPLPAEDPMELEPTKIFVQRAGVRPSDGKPSVKNEPTRKVIAPEFGDAPSVPPTVATEVHWKEGSGSHAARPPHSDTISDELVVETHTQTPREPLPAHSQRFRAPSHPRVNVATTPPNGSFHGHPPIAMSPNATGEAPVMPLNTQQIIVPPSRGVSVGVLIGSVLVAAILGAILAVTITQSLNPTPVLVTATPPVPPSPTEGDPTPTVKPRSPGVEERAAATIEPVVPPPPAAATEDNAATTKKRPRPPAKNETHEVAPPVAPASPEQTRSKVDEELRAVLAETEAMIAKLPSGPKKEQLIQLKLDLKRDQSVLDAEKLAEKVRRAKAELAKE